MSDGITNYLEVNPAALYNSPQQLDIENFNFVEFKAIAGESFGPSSTITVRANSTNELIDWDRSFIKGTFTATGSGSVLSDLGIGAAFKNVQETISGVSLPILTDWNLTHSLENRLSTAERKDWLKVTELCSTGLTIGSTATTFSLAVPSQLATSDRYFPLAVVSGGVEFTWTLESAANVFKVAGTGYSITNFGLVLCMVSPSASYLNELSRGVSSGHSLKIPLELRRVVHQPLTTSLSQTLKVQTGFLRSINGLTLIVRDKDNLDVATADAFVGASKLNNISYYNIGVNSVVYPRNRFLYIKDNRAENLMNILSGFNTKYSGISVPAGATDDFAFFNFKANSGFGAGITSTDGFCELNLSIGTAFDAGDMSSIIVSYDASLQIEDGIVTVTI